MMDISTLGEIHDKSGCGQPHSTTLLATFVLLLRQPLGGLPRNAIWLCSTAHPTARVFVEI